MRITISPSVIVGFQRPHPLSFRTPGFSRMHDQARAGEPEVVAEVATTKNSLTEEPTLARGTEVLKS